MCCHSLLQGIFPTQGVNRGLLHCRWILYRPSHEGSPSLLSPVELGDPPGWEEWFESLFCSLGCHSSKWAQGGSEGLQL